MTTLLPKRIGYEPDMMLWIAGVLTFVSDIASFVLLFSVPWLCVCVCLFLCQVGDLQAVLKARGADKIYLLDGVNTDSGLRVKTKASFEGLADYEVDETQLHELLVMSRV